LYWDEGSGKWELKNFSLAFLNGAWSSVAMEEHVIRQCKVTIRNRGSVLHYEALFCQEADSSPECVRGWPCQSGCVAADTFVLGDQAKKFQIGLREQVQSRFQQSPLLLVNALSC
jgi:hypothetical protein